MLQLKTTTPERFFLIPEKKKPQNTTTLFSHVHEKIVSIVSENQFSHAALAGHFLVLTWTKGVLNAVGEEVIYKFVMSYKVPKLVRASKSEYAPTRRGGTSSEAYARDRL